MPVYFIQAGNEGPVKIGHGRDPERRLDNLQLGSVEPLRLLGTLPGASSEEGALHLRFAADHIRGEWFKFNPEMLEGLTHPRIRKRGLPNRNRLDGWIKKNELTQAAFAEMIGVSQGAVARFVLGLRIPNRQTMRKIFDATEGQVTPNDFHDMALPQDAA